jgi:hypothetical protein
MVWLAYMRTTVDIPDPIYRQLKSRAALQGRSVKELILEGVEAELGIETGRQRKRRISLPLIKSRHPGRLRLSNKTINEILLP